MKTYIYAILAVALLATSCSKEDALVNKLDFSSPYVIEDDPNDPVQHHRYLIYKEYGVPVFFNDTIAEKYIGDAHDGTPLYRYETLDLNWSFSSHNKRSVTYIYDYIEDPEQQELGLKFVDEFLKHASEPMRPFCIFLTDGLTIKSSSKTETPDFFSGFRTLTIPDVQEVAMEDIPEFSMTILKSMVTAKVTNNTALSEKFGEVSNTEKYYSKSWTTDLKCVWGLTHKGIYWKPSTLYGEGIPERYVSYYWETGCNTLEDFETERALIFSEIGRFGFICGDLSNDGMLEHLQSPSSIAEDLKYYVTTMLELGSEEFERRYCDSDMVKEKYDILYDYIVNELKVEF